MLQWLRNILQVLKSFLSDLVCAPAIVCQAQGICESGFFSYAAKMNLHFYLLYAVSKKVSGNRSSALWPSRPPPGILGI